jgi:EAL domain-containing protein (putative c-di-GMP-specific phosphodiesterase class I)
VRWRHPTKGILQPIAFMSGTEATGMIVELSDYIVGEVCKQIAMFVKAGKRTPVSTYLSPVYFATGYVGNGIKNFIAIFDIPADMLQIEISERAISESFDKVAAQIDQLRSLGVKVVLSGFGVGSSSLVHLWRIPNDGVKVDESVIQSLAADPKVERMLSGLVTMALGAERVIVEGVQTQEQASWLQRFPGIRAWGSHFSAAVGEPAIETGGIDGKQ